MASFGQIRSSGGKSLNLNDQGAWMNDQGALMEDKIIDQNYLHQLIVQGNEDRKKQTGNIYNIRNALTDAINGDGVIRESDAYNAQLAKDRNAWTENQNRINSPEYQQKMLMGELQIQQAQQALKPKPATTPAGYRLTQSGDLEAIPGGPADIKAGALAQQKALGASDVDSAVASLRNAYDRLEKGGGITSTKNGPLDNMAAAASSSGLGQAVGKALGTDNQSARNDVAMTRPALLAALMKATGMSAKQMDSNAELKLWMTTATDPSLDVEANRRALDAIERKYIGGGQQSAPHSMSQNKQPPSTNQQGWQLHTDARGNKAYVGPQGQIQEVR